MADTGIAAMYPKVKQAATRTSSMYNELLMGSAATGHRELSVSCPTGNVSSVGVWLTTTGGDWWYGRANYDPAADKLRYDYQYNATTGFGLATGDAVTVSCAPMPAHHSELVFLSKHTQNCSSATGGSSTVVDFGSASGGIQFDPYGLWSATGTTVASSPECTYRHAVVSAFWSATTGATTRTLTADFSGISYAVATTSPTAAEPMSAAHIAEAADITISCQHDGTATGGVDVQVILAVYDIR
jgi:hypothetical protein